MQNSERKIANILFQLLVLLWVLCYLPLFSLVMGPTFTGDLSKIICIGGIFLYLNNYKKMCFAQSNTYIGVMIVAFILHSLFTSNVNILQPFWESLKWILIVVIMVVSKDHKDCRILVYVLFIFYLSQVGMSIYERCTLSNIVDYASFIKGDNQLGFRIAEQYNETSEFRSCALLGHGLNNANVTSIIMAFILCSRMNNYTKYVLLALGGLALWGFNSRAAIGCWFLIFLLRFLFKSNNVLYLFFAFGIIFLILPLFVDYISTGILGRFNFDFSDDSSAARVFAFELFFMHDWTLEQILFGGLIIYIPGTELSLENGVLLNLCYWGWIIGILKTILEVGITYVVLPAYLNRDEKFLILLATWGVAFGNNNSFQPLVISFYMFTLIAFNSLNYLMQVRKI